MFEYLEKLRQKPEGAKKRFAFLTAFTISGIIFVVWLSVIYPDLTEQKKRDDKVKNLESSPLSSFIENVSYGFGQIGKSFDGIKETIDMLKTQPEYYESSTSTASSTSKAEIEGKSTGLEIYNLSSSTATSTKTSN